MTDDYRNTGGEEIESAISEDDSAGDPAAAFDALRATVEDASSDLTREMTTIRKGVEAAFDQLERVGASADYSADLGRIVQTLTTLNERLTAVEKSPLLRQGADQFAARLERTGESLVRVAAQTLENRASDLERVTRNLSAHVEGARERRRQNWWLVGVGGLCVVAGILLTLIAPAALPFSAAPRVASFVMGQDPWRAGIALMAFDSPTSWGRVAFADQLIQMNSISVQECLAAASRAGKEQKCTIMVPVSKDLQ